MPKRIKVFVDSDVISIEKNINTFLAENPAIEVLNIFATEAVIDGVAWSTVYLLYNQ